MERMNKTKAVLNHLEQYGKISSMEAFKLFGATRLSAIIYNLRHEYGLNIVNETVKIKDRYNNTCLFDYYILVKED
jgi:hypothetical protein